MTEEDAQQQDASGTDEDREEPLDSPAGETAGERADRERGGPTGGEGDTNVQDSDEDAATPDGST